MHPPILHLEPHCTLHLEPQRTPISSFISPDPDPDPALGCDGSPEKAGCIGYAREYPGRAGNTLGMGLSMPITPPLSTLDEQATRLGSGLASVLEL